MSSPRPKSISESPAAEPHGLEPRASELRASELRYRRLFETARDGMLILDAVSEKITDVNPFMMQLAGLEREEIVGRELWEIGLLPDADASAAALQTLRERSAFRFEVLPLQNPRSARPDLEIVANAYDEAGHWVVQCNVRDITQRKKSEAQMEFQADLLGIVDQAIIATDLKGKITFWNRAAQEIYGWSDEEALGHSVSALVVPPASAHVAVEIRQKIARGERWSGQFEVQRRDGTPFSTHVSNSPIYDAAGTLVGAVSVSTDITQRKRLEDAQAQLASIVESSRDAIFSTALNGNILTWNRGAQELFGYNAEEALGCSLALIFPSALASQGAAILEGIRRGETMANFEMPLARKGGPASVENHAAASGSRPAVNRRRFPARDSQSEQISLSISPIFDAEGTLLGASGIARDISEQIRAGQASRRNEKLYRALTSNFPNGAVYLLDLEGRFFLAEGRGMATIGYSSDQFLGQTLEDIFGGTPLYFAMNSIFEGALQGHETVSELLINGRMRVVRGVPVLDDEGHTSFVLAMSQDITEQKEAEIALAEREMQLRALVESMEEVVFQFDTHGTYLNIWTNDERRLVRPKSEMIGRRLAEIKGYNQAQPILEAIARIAAGGPPEVLEYRLPSDTRQVWVASRLSPVSAPDGSIHSVCMLTRDITEKKRTEEALEQTNREILTIWDSMSDAFYALDTQWNFTHANAQAGVLMHRDPAQLIGKNIWQEFPDAVDLRFHDEFHRAMRDQVPVTFEEFFAPLEMWTESHIYPSKVGLSVYFRDITDRKRDEQAIRASEARFQGIVANVPGMVYQFVVRPDGGINFPFVSEGSLELAGLQPEQIRENAQLMLDILHPEDRAGYVRSVAESAITMQPWSWEGRGRLQSGRTKWVQGVSRPRQMPDGNILWDGLLIDITARREAEDERDRFFTLSPDMLGIADKQGFYKRVNPAFEAVLGYSTHELLTRPFIEFVHPDDREMTRAEALKLRSGVPTTNFINRCICRDGLVKWLSWQAVPFEDVSYVAAHDITPLVEAEAALRRANEELELRVEERTAELATANEGLRAAVLAIGAAKEEAERANGAKSEFLSRMSHELRTPLNAILGFGQILQSSELSQIDQEHVTQILQGGWHLLDLINEILDIARVEAGHLVLALEPVSLAALISESCALVRPLAAQRNVRLDESEVAREDCHVLADRQRLKQVIINLLSNGIKYNRRGGQVSVSCAARPNDRLSIAIRDTGQGLSAEERAKLFMPFERLRAADSGIEGTGLGLVLSRRLVTAMQGQLEVESVEGQGSVFSIELPQASAPAAARDDAAPAQISLSPGSDTASQGLYTVLCVEDNTANLQLLEVILMERPEITMISTSHGEAGLNLARQHDLDLILLDLNLPDIAGDEVLQRLQEAEKTRDVPVIIISADATPPQIARLLKAGAKDYLTKPFDVHRFLDVLDATLLHAEPASKSSKAPTEPPGIEESPTTSPPQSVPQLLSQPVRPLRILVAEDNLVNQKIVAHQLQNLGHQMEIHDNGYDIIEAWQGGDFDLILMDCHMPRMDGYTTTIEIRTQEDERAAAEGTTDVTRIPIVALTANAVAGDRERSLAAGMNDHLCKPIKQADLAAALSHWTSNLEAAPRAAAPAAPAEAEIVLEAEVLNSEHWNELKSELDPELLQDLVQIFLAEAPQLIADLKHAADAGDRLQLREIAHKAKGSCSTMGVARMATLCAAIEKQAQNGDLGLLPAHLARLEDELVLAQAELETFLASPNA